MTIISSTKYSRKFNALKFAHFCCWRDMCRKYLIYNVNSNCCTNILLARKLWVASDIFCLKLHEMCTTDNLIWRNIQLLQFKAFLSRLLVMLYVLYFDCLWYKKDNLIKTVRFQQWPTFWQQIWWCKSGMRWTRKQCMVYKW